MPEDLDAIGVETTDVAPDSTTLNVVIGVVGLIFLVAALIPLTAGALWVGSIAFAAGRAIFGDGSLGL